MSTCLIVNLQRPARTNHTPFPNKLNPPPFFFSFLRLLGMLLPENHRYTTLVQPTLACSFIYIYIYITYINAQNAQVPSFIFWRGFWKKGGDVYKGWTCPTRWLSAEERRPFWTLIGHSPSLWHPGGPSKAASTEEDDTSSWLSSFLREVVKFDIACCLKQHPFLYGDWILKQKAACSDPCLSCSCFLLFDISELYLVSPFGLDFKLKQWEIQDLWGWMTEGRIVNGSTTCWDEVMAVSSFHSASATCHCLDGHGISRWNQWELRIDKDQDEENEEETYDEWNEMKWYKMR